METHTYTCYQFEMTSRQFFQMGKDLMDFCKENRIFALTYNLNAGEDIVQLSLSFGNYLEFKHRLNARNEELMELMGRS